MHDYNNTFKETWCSQILCHPQNCYLHIYHFLTTLHNTIYGKTFKWESFLKYNSQKKIAVACLLAHTAEQEGHHKF